MVDWGEGQSTPRKYKPIFFVRCNAAGALLVLREKQQLKIPQEAVFASEEAEAVPAESDFPERKSTCSYFAV